MAELKTKATKESVTKFLNSIEPQEKRTDGLALLKIFEKATGVVTQMRRGGWWVSFLGGGKGVRIIFFH